MQTLGSHRPHALLLLLLLFATAGAAGSGEVKITEPSYLDRQYMIQQRELLGEIAAIELGRRFSGDKNNDLGILQLLLDKQLVRASQTRELQAMGVIMGDLLATDLGMHWVIYEDALGRSRALRYERSDEYLFPITMIARRRAAGNDTPVTAIYQKAYDIIAPLLPPQPFQ